MLDKLVKPVYNGQIDKAVMAIKPIRGVELFKNLNELLSWLAAMLAWWTLPLRNVVSGFAEWSARICGWSSGVRLVFQTGTGGFESHHPLHY